MTLAVAIEAYARVSVCSPATGVLFHRFVSSMLQREYRRRGLGDGDGRQRAQAHNAEMDRAIPRSHCATLTARGEKSSNYSADAMRGGLRVVNRRAISSEYVC